MDLAPRILALCSLLLVCGILTSANWPSTFGTTAEGIVIENGTTGVALGTVANPLVCQ